MNRRAALKAMIVIGAAAASFPGVAQTPDDVRRIGALIGLSENDREGQMRLAAFKETLADLGWIEGRNLRIDVRWSSADANLASVMARQLIALQPEVILSNTTPVTTALKRETATIPIVFTGVSDPIGSGFVQSLSHPGGNITGFVNLESSLAEKWLQVLKEIAPQVTRVEAMFNPDTASFAKYYLRPLKSRATKFGVQVFSTTVHSGADIEAAIASLSRKGNSGLIVIPDAFMINHRKLHIALVARYRVPTVYYGSYFVLDGGLVSYGVDIPELHRDAAQYVDRILRGAKVADLPVQQPTKFELAVNRKAANALGLTIPQSVLLRATQVVE
jgi:putative ABC transport system substrate-binding protein